MNLYDSLLGKDEVLVRAEIEQIDASIDLTMTRGREWIISQLAPNGPIGRDRSLGIVYKATWLLYFLEERERLAELLTWVAENARQENGDLAFPDGDGAGPDPQRCYRSCMILWAATMSDHDLAADDEVYKRLLGYQDQLTGGVWPYIGEDPGAPSHPTTCNVRETGILVKLALAREDKETARRAGQWLVSLVEQNADSLGSGQAFYWHADGEGRVVRETSHSASHAWAVRADATAPPSWVTGMSMGVLADLFEAASAAGEEGDATRYLESALALARFEAQMPIESYYTFNKGKVAWGAGRLLSVLLSHHRATPENIDWLYRSGRRAYLNTFLASQRPDGSWGHDFYPLSLGPEMAIDQRLMTNFSSVPPASWAENSSTGKAIDALEVTAEHYDWIHHLGLGMKDLKANVDWLLDARVGDGGSNGSGTQDDHTTTGEAGARESEHVRFQY